MELSQKESCTYADLLSWDDGIRYELYDGVPVAMSSPSFEHQQISIALSFQLFSLTRNKNCEVIPAPFDVFLFDENVEEAEEIRTIVQPDLLIVCDPSRISANGVHGAPDMVVEILSESTRRNDRLIKYRLYQKAGVKEYWIIDPDTRVTLVHTLEDGQYASPAIYNSSATVYLTIAEDCPVDLSEIFPDNG